MEMLFWRANSIVSYLSHIQSSSRRVALLLKVVYHPDVSEIRNNSNPIRSINTTRQEALQVVTRMSDESL